MKRRLPRTLATVLLAGLLVQGRAAADENGYVDVPDGAIKSMDLGRAMDVVTSHLGHYWLRSLRWTCPYETPAGERGADNYGVRLENFLGVHTGDVAAWPASGTIIFHYAPVPHNFCRIPARLASEQDAVELATAFRRLAREPAKTRQPAIAARYALDVGNAASIQRFLRTEASLDIARLLLEDAVRSLVQPGGAGEFVGAPAPLPAGSEYRVTADYLTEAGEPDRQDAWSFRLLAAGPGGYQVQKVWGRRTDDCSDPGFFRAITQDAPQSCRDQDGYVTKTTLLAQEGQASWLPAAINTAAVYEAETDAVISSPSGREFTRRGRQIRACYVEAAETIAVPAGSFDTVRFRCGSVTSDSRVHDKRYGLVWVDRNTGLPVRSEMETHSVHQSSLYRMNQQAVSLTTP